MNDFVSIEMRFSDEPLAADLAEEFPLVFPMQELDVTVKCVLRCERFRAVRTHEQRLIEMLHLIVDVKFAIASEGAWTFLALERATMGPLDMSEQLAIEREFLLALQTFVRFGFRYCHCVIDESLKILELFSVRALNDF